MTEEKSGRSASNADMLRIVARIVRTSAQAVVYLSDGAWNPNFCSADCSAFALSVC